MFSNKTFIFYFFAKQQALTRSYNSINESTGIIFQIAFFAKLTYFSYFFIFLRLSSFELVAADVMVLTSGTSSLNLITASSFVSKQK